VLPEGPLLRTHFILTVASRRGSRPCWDITPDGRRFLFQAQAAQAQDAQFTVILNGQAGLKK